jgi:hypothetical protein
MNSGAFLLDCLRLLKHPKVYFTPQNVLDYINRWKIVIGNPAFKKTK